MIHRRVFVLSAAAATLLPSFARAGASRLSVSGSQEQGSDGRSYSEW